MDIQNILVVAVMTTSLLMMSMHLAFAEIKVRKNVDAGVSIATFRMCLPMHFLLYFIDRLWLSRDDAKGMSPFDILGLIPGICVLLTCIVIIVRIQSHENELKQSKKNTLLIAALVLGLVVASDIYSFHFDKNGLAMYFSYGVLAVLVAHHVSLSFSMNVSHSSAWETRAMQYTPNGVLLIDEHGKIVLANPSIVQLTGYSESELRGLCVEAILPKEKHPACANATKRFFNHPPLQTTKKKEFELISKSGQKLPVEVAFCCWGNSEDRHAIAYIHDIRERRAFEQSLRHQAAHDELTGLPNRRHFRVQLNQVLERAKRRKEYFAVLFLDLDHFKAANDSLGHAIGDELLIQVSKRIKDEIGNSDYLARLGGDEFSILLTDITSKEQATCIARNILASLEATFHVCEHDVYLGGSLGMAFYPEDAKDCETLLRYADMAMYHAKQSGRGGYASYSTDLDSRIHEDLQIHARLKEALASNSLELYFQPQVGVESGEIVGSEALLRWNDQLLGMVPPSRFIPVAEATGLILPLSDWVLEAACRQISLWDSMGMPVRVAINISSHQFRQSNYVGKVEYALRNANIGGELLDIEITESVAMRHPEQAREQIAALVALGCRVALDDFGTGYSSLAYLKSLPVSKLKIDKSFMDAIPESQSDITICKTIITLAHSLGMTIVAEGVERQCQLSFLHEQECEIYQGWLFERALPAEKFQQLLRQNSQVDVESSVYS